MLTPKEMLQKGVFGGTYFAELVDHVRLHVLHQPIVAGNQIRQALLSAEAVCEPAHELFHIANAVKVLLDRRVPAEGHVDRPEEPLHGRNR